MLAFLIALSMTASAQSARQQQDQAAKATFAGLQFFSKGHGMHLSPGLSSMLKPFSDSKGRLKDGFVKDKIQNTWGLQINDEGKIAGFHEVPYKGLKVGVVGCAVCHSGRAAGQYIIGLGNKNVDVVKMATELQSIEKNWKALKPEFSKSEDYKFVETSALNFSKYLSNDKIGNLTQGLVPVSFIRGWFYRVQNEPIPDDVTRGQVKVPFLWGYGLKRKVGQFCDGYGNGEFPGWAVAVELAAGQTPENVREYLPEVDKVEALFEHFLPPKYPFKIESGLAAQGMTLFNQRCAGCHGTYSKDESGEPIFQAPNFIDVSVVQTDEDRLNGNIPAFNAQVARSPLSDVIRSNSLGRGYFAPRLEGIWARFPYLHNGSIPNIRALLSPPELRPKSFSLRRAGERERFDESALGLTVKAVKGGGRDIYDTKRIGHSNKGHDFYTNMTEDEKSAVIEYLKVL